jgi:hypothetical protein
MSPDFLSAVRTARAAKVFSSKLRLTAYSSSREEPFHRRKSCVRITLIRLGVYRHHTHTVDRPQAAVSLSGIIKPLTKPVIGLENTINISPKHPP